MKTLAVCELATVVQGEGKLMGVPNFMVRMTGCNLRCPWCDTPYTSWNPEKGKYNAGDIMNLIKMNPQIKHVFITGGNPCNQPDLLNSLLVLFKARGIHTCIEDNGTQFVAKLMIDLVSISPKMKNSIPVGTKWEEKHRAIIENQTKSIALWVEQYENVQLKFVIQNEADIQEALALVKEVKATNVYFMPEGKTNEELAPRRQWLVQRCIELGVNYTDRLHVVVFGDKRGV